MDDTARRTRTPVPTTPATTPATNVDLRSLDLAPVFAWLEDPEGHCTWVNRAWLDFSGRTLDEESGQGWTERIHPDDFDRTMGLHREKHCRREAYENRYRLRRGDGEYRSIVDRGWPRYAEDGTHLGYIGFAADVTDYELVVAERDAAAQVQELVIAALNAASRGVVITRPDGAIVWVNDAFTRNTGYTAGEVIGKNPRILKSGQQDESFYRQLWETVCRGDVWSGDLVNARKDGSHYREAMSITPVRNGGGELTYFVAVKEDVSEQQRLREQLIHAQRMESMGALAAGVAHDFNNILGAVIGYAEMAALELEPGSAARRDLDELLAAAGRGAALTRQLLAFARKQPVAPREADANELVAGVLSMLRRLCGQSVRVVYEPASLPLPVRIDPGQFEQVVMNLVVNARDAMPTGGRVTISLHRLESASDCQGPRVAVEVADSGSGIPAHVGDRIFEPFFTTKAPGRGTGLGLATSASIVAQAGGHLGYESRPGEGTTFTIELPLAAGEATCGAPARQCPGAAAAHLPAVILVVENDHDLRALDERTLSAAGYTVLSAENPIRALEHAADHPEIDAVVLDAHLPVMTGQVLCDVLGRVIGPRPVLMTSAFADEPLCDDAIASGAGRFLQKPFTPAQLLAEVGALLATRR
ncbi:MAG: PAS domain S-box protein [Dehalococcoidia bacterium]|nr:PAS domain S-box protein [Dehalococcoidia bacterium]